MEKQNSIMSGNEAIARGAWEAGVSFATAYPGTPSTEILEALVHYDEVEAQWSTNEKVALECAFGASLAGKRAIVSMKHVGVNVALDPLTTIAYSGVNGGLVLFSGDDPGMFSSQNEQDNRHIARFAHIPMLEPACPSEAKEMTSLAFEISEEFDIPVFLRGTTRLCHGRGLLKTGPRKEIHPKLYTKNYDKYMMLPTVSRKRRVDLAHRMTRLAELSETTPINRVIEGSDKIGIITSGVASRHAREAVADASFLVLGMTHPLPTEKIRKFASTVKKVYVVEELSPFLETEIRALGIEVLGQEVIPHFGELRPEIVAEAIESKESSKSRSQSVNAPTRPPLLCPGCGHRPVFDTLRKLGATVAGDIGCYALGAHAPLSGMDMNLCMGASISVAQGIEKVSGPSGKVVGVIGDSTFLHSGIPALVDLVYNQGAATIMLLDNSTTAMTGHQDHPGTGRTAKGLESPPINYAMLAEAIGIRRVVTVNPLHVSKLRECLIEAMDSNEPSLIIARTPCALQSRKKATHVIKVSTDLCTTCGTCLNIGCPAIVKDADGFASVSNSVCVGCSVCSQICENKAMVLRPREGGQ